MGVAQPTGMNKSVRKKRKKLPFVYIVQDTVTCKPTTIQYHVIYDDIIKKANK